MSAVQILLSVSDWSFRSHIAAMQKVARPVLLFWHFFKRHRLGDVFLARCCLSQARLFAPMHCLLQKSPHKFNFHCLVWCIQSCVCSCYSKWVANLQQVNGDKCSQKWRNLVKEYHLYRARCLSAGDACRSAPWFIEPLDEILMLKPASVIDSVSGNYLVICISFLSTFCKILFFAQEY